jgi:hypothetical protein
MMMPTENIPFKLPPRRAGMLSVNVLQCHIPTRTSSKAHTAAVLHRAQQQCTAVAELGHEAAELMSSVGHGKGFGPVRQPVACEYLHSLRRGKPIRIDPEMAGEGLVQPD